MTTETFKESQYQPVRRDQIIGLETVMDQAEGLIDFLKNFRDYDELDAEIPAGVVLVGARGYGKTTVAKYIATQAGALFINLDDLVKTGIEDVYKLAREYVKKENKPVILFQDEFDKKYLDNGYGGMGLKEEGNALLKILDGIEGQEKNRGIFLVGTANNVGKNGEVPLFRPGRLEKLFFYPPTRDDKVKLIELFLDEFVAENGKPVKADKNIDVEALSYVFDENDSPAFIRSIVRDAYRNSCKRYIAKGKPEAGIVIATEDIYETIVQKKLENPIVLDVTPEELKKTAVHEIGHYLVSKEMGIDAPFVTVIPTFQTLGQTFISEKRKDLTLKNAIGYIAACQAGYLAEELCGYEMGLGASSDIERAEGIARLVNKFQDFRADCKLKKHRKQKQPVINTEGISVNDAFLLKVASMIDDCNQDSEKSKIEQLQKENMNRRALAQAEQAGRAILKKYGRAKIERVAEVLAKEKTLFGRTIEDLLIED